MHDWLSVGGLSLGSRLFVGTGKYRDNAEARAAIAASGSEVVTVAVRRLEVSGEPSSPQCEPLLVWLRERGLHVLPNTAGCTTAEQAVRTSRLARELLGTSLVKLEVIADARTLYPDVVQTLEAARTLTSEGFTVLPYTTDDPITAKKLEDIGCAAVMPLAAPIGSGLGIRNPYNIEIILESVRVPVIVDAGVGTASDAAIAMELGCHGVLMNTAIAGARDPALMAAAMRKAVEAGRQAYLAGRIPRKLYASASSPLEGVVGSRQG